MLGHETLHAVNDDGTGGISEEDAQEGQEALSKDPTMTEEQLKEKLIADGKTPEEAAKIAGEIFEDVRAHTFDTKIWGSLKKQFMIKDLEMDAKHMFYKSGIKDFNEYLFDMYSLGKDKSEMLGCEYGASYVKKKIYETARTKMQEKTNANKKKADDSYDEFKYDYMILRSNYMAILKKNDQMNQYKVKDFELDLNAIFDKSILKEGQEIESLEKDYNILEKMNLDIGFTDKEWKSILKDYKGGVTEENKKIAIAKMYGNVFNNVIDSMYYGGYEANFDKVLEFSKKIDVSTTGMKNSMVYLFNQYMDYDSSNLEKSTERTKVKNGKTYKKKFYDVKNVNTNSEEYYGHSTFLEYYMTQDLKSLNELNSAIGEKTIKINSKKASFIANIDYLTNISLLANETGTDPSDSKNKKFDVDTILITNGYRSLKKNMNMWTNTKNHPTNSALDFILYSDDLKTKSNTTGVVDKAIVLAHALDYKDKNGDPYFKGLELPSGSFNHIDVYSPRPYNQMFFWPAKVDTIKAWVKKMGLEFSYETTIEYTDKNGKKQKKKVTIDQDNMDNMQYNDQAKKAIYDAIKAQYEDFLDDYYNPSEEESSDDDSKEE